MGNLPENQTVESEEQFDPAKFAEMLGAHEQLCSATTQAGDDAVSKALSDVCKIENNGSNVEKMRRTNRLISQLFEFFAPDEKDPQAKWDRLNEVFSGEKQNDLKNMIELAQNSTDCVVEPISHGVFTVSFLAGGKAPERYQMVLDESAATRDIGPSFAEGFARHLLRGRGDVGNKEKDEGFTQSVQRMNEEVMKMVFSNESKKPEEFLADLEKIRTAQRAKDYTDQITRAQEFTTPESVNEKLSTITSTLDEDIRNELAGPILNMTKSWSEASVDPETGALNLGLEYYENEKELVKILKDRFGENYQETMPPDQLADLRAIGETFGID